MSDSKRILVLAIIVALLALVWWLGGRSSAVAGQRTFREHLVQVDTAALRSFSLVPAPAKHRPPLHFTRSGAGWSVTSEGHDTPAFQRSMDEFLALLADVRPLNVPGKGPAMRARYGLEDSLADRVQLPGPGGATLLIGRASTGPETSTAMMRDGDPMVYLVPGRYDIYAGMSFTNWIPKPMVNGDPGHWKRLTFQFPGGRSYALERTATGWAIGGVPADGPKVLKYLRALSLYHGNALADPADTLHATLVYRMEVEDDTRDRPIVLGIFDAGGKLLARSSLAPAWLVMPFDPRMELPRMFRPPEAFLPGEHPG